MSRRLTTLVGSLLITVVLAGAAAAEQGDTELGVRALWVTGSATSAGTIGDTGSSVTLSSGPGIELDWIAWPLDELTLELSLGASAHPIGTSGGAFDGLDGGTLWRFPIGAVVQYRPHIAGQFDPYVGLGLVYQIMVPEMSSDYSARLSDLEFSNDLNLVAQVGVSYAIDVRWSANLDLRYTGLRTTGTFTANDGSALGEYDFKMDPWVIGLGFRYRY